MNHPSENWKMRIALKLNEFRVDMIAAVMEAKASKLNSNIASITGMVKEH